MARGLRESALWIFGALALILFASLVSYDRADPAFSSTGQPGPVTNLIGPFGAWLSDLFFVLFGFPAYLFPIMLGIAGYRLFQERGSREPVDRRSASFRGLGFFLALASSCGLATLHFSGTGDSIRGGLRSATFFCSCCTTSCRACFTSLPMFWSRRSEARSRR